MQRKVEIDRGKLEIAEKEEKGKETRKHREKRKKQQCTDTEKK